MIQPTTTPRPARNPVSRRGAASPNSSILAPRQTVTAQNPDAAPLLNAS